MSTAFLGPDYVGRTIEGTFPLLGWLAGTDESAVFLTELAGAPPQRAAIKLIPDSGPDSESRLAAWQTASTLSHPNLFRVFDLGRSVLDGQPVLYIVTEHSDEILSDVLSARPLTPDETGEMLAPVLDALSYLHQRNLVHGHLKPSNILVVDEHLKLSLDRLSPAPGPGRPALPGDPCEAPESASETTTATDIWSLGALIVEALSQQPPALDPSSAADPAIPASIPPPYSAIARECLRVFPARRPTINDIQLELAPAAPAPPIPPPAPAQPIPASKPSPAARPAPAASFERAQILPPPAPMAAAQAKYSTQKPRRIPLPLILGAAVLIVCGVVAGLVIGSHHKRTLPPATIADSAPPAPKPSPRVPPRKFSASAGTGSVIQQVLPDVPEKALRTIHGQFISEIRVNVDAQGYVTSAAIESQGPSRYFAGFALEAARDWKFRPVRADDHAVPSTWTLKFRFEPSGATATAAQTSP